MSFDFIKPQKVLINCRICGNIYRSEVMTEFNVSAVGTLAHPDKESTHMKLPCGHFVGVRGLIPGFRPSGFWQMTPEGWKALGEPQ